MENNPIIDMLEAENLVKQVLQEDARSRCDDLWLILQCWKKQGLKIYVDYNQLQQVFSPETIRRSRQMIQNDKCQFLPADPQVLIKRRMKEAAITEWFGTKSKVYEDWQSLKYQIK